jgi:hypothetical protein
VAQVGIQDSAFFQVVSYFVAFNVAIGNSDSIAPNDWIIMDNGLE